MLFSKLSKGKKHKVEGRYIMVVFPYFRHKKKHRGQIHYFFECPSFRKKHILEWRCIIHLQHLSFERKHRLDGRCIICLWLQYILKWQILIQPDRLFDVTHAKCHISYKSTFINTESLKICRFQGHFLVLVVALLRI